MKRLLYITDREEYSKHNFIGPLFEKYLARYMEVESVYFTRFKSCSQTKGTHHIIPEHEKTNLFFCLENNGVDVSKFDIVIVRNMHDVLEYVLSNKTKYDFKVGYRLSFPKITGLLERAKAENRASLFNIIEHKIKTYIKSKLINRCDIFLPTSKQMQEIYYPDVKTKIITIPSAIDPENLNKKRIIDNGKIIFSYNGTLSKLRNFELIFKVFCSLNSENWELRISTKDTKYAKDIVEGCTEAEDKIKIFKASTKDELFDFIRECDIGLALLPNISIFNTSIPLKVMDYYSNAVPTLMTNNAQNSMIFTDGKDGWLCDFDEEAIKEKISYLLTLSKEEIAKIGERGQERLLDVRNYEKIAIDLANTLNKL